MRLLLPLLLAAGMAGDLGAQSDPARSGGRGSAWPLGLELEVAYAGDLFVPAEGDRSNEAVYVDNLDLLAHLYLDPFGLRGAAVRIHVQSNRGASISERVGDIQGVSSIDAPRDWRVYEAWLELNPIPGHLSLLAGLLDVNSEFDVTPGAIELINSSFGFGPEYGLAARGSASTFPLTRVGARALTHPFGDSRAYLNFGVTEAVADSAGALLSAELGFAVPLADRSPDAATDSTETVQVRRRIGRGRGFDEERSKLAVGGWTYTKDLPAWSDAAPGASFGVYALGHHRFYERGATALGGFVRGGWASTAVNRISAFYAAGLVLHAPLPGRPADILALGVAHARNGDPFLEAELAEGRAFRAAETVLEATYKFEVLGWLQLEPDVQWVIHPGADPGLRNALLFGIRWSAAARFP